MIRANDTFDRIVRTGVVSERVRGHAGTGDLTVCLSRGAALHLLDQLGDVVQWRQIGEESTDILVHPRLVSRVVSIAEALASAR